jgi:hypothetical protein
LVSGPVLNPSPVYGGTPTVPSPGGTQTGAVNNNLAILSALYGLAGGAGGASATGAGSQFDTNLPGWRTAAATSLGNTQSLLQGQIPKDVQAVLNEQIAERGIQSGIPGSPNVDTNALVKYLGTSLGLQQQGEQNLSAAMARTPQGPQFNPASMFLDPSTQQGWQWLANMLGAAPVPSQVGQSNLNALRQGIGQGRGSTQPGPNDPAFWNNLANSLNPPGTKTGTGPSGTPSPGTVPTGGYPNFNPNAAVIPTSSGENLTPDEWAIAQQMGFTNPDDYINYMNEMGMPVQGAQNATDIGEGTYVDPETGQIISTGDTSSLEDLYSSSGDYGGEG